MDYRITIWPFKKGLNIGPKRGFLICLALGFLIRLVPEVLSFPYPIGFDTVYYAARIKSGVIWSHWSSVFSTTWLLYAILVPTYEVVRGDPFLLMKLTAPALYALNVGGIYYFARRWLGWKVKTAKTDVSTVEGIVEVNL